MVRKTLVIAPHSGWLNEVDPFDGVGVLVLDDLLMAGLAGVYFRRLRVTAALHPAVRVEYDQKRHTYLREVLAEMHFEDSTVIVGSHPTDVDLLEYDHVCAIRVSDRGMRDMSKLVYGDPVMLCVEYQSVLRSVADAVDAWHHVVSWREISMIVMRQFPERARVPVGVSPARQKGILADMLSGEDDVAVWLEDDLHIDVPMGRFFLIADYDYLTVMRPKWRDAVVRLLGSAPAIEQVFRLPWYLVEPSALNTLCYRPNVYGVPTASTRGQSLVEFVRNRMPSVFTTRELAGTWIGGFLCDDVTAVDTIAALGTETLVAVDTVGVRREVTDGHALHVPSELAWAYQAVPDVRVVAWDGPRRLDGAPKIDAVVGSWAVTLPLAAVYASHVSDLDMGAAVVHMLQRLHAVGVDAAFVRLLTECAMSVQSEGLTQEGFDPGLMPLLPGYNYAYCFVPSVRFAVMQSLGLNPSLAMLLRCASAYVSDDGVVSIAELCADVSRTMLFAGKTVRSFYSALSVGWSGHDLPPGYCYGCLFKVKYRDRAYKILGAYPTLQQLMHRRMVSWHLDDALDSVFVTCRFSRRSKGEWILHFSPLREGVSLRDLMRVVRYERRVISKVLVGDAGVCYGATWYVLAIIAWTIVGVVLFGVLMWFWYLRCAGGRGSGSRGGYARR